MKIQMTLKGNGLTNDGFKSISNLSIFERKIFKFANDNNLPDWQIVILDKRLKRIKDFPESVRPIEDFIAELKQ